MQESVYAPRNAGKLGLCSKEHNYIYMAKEHIIECLIKFFLRLAERSGIPLAAPAGFGCLRGRVQSTTCT